MNEGRILLSSGAQTQERYLFLFSDLLLVAKEKGDNSYRLKDRVRLNEVWICRDKVEEISECVKNPLNSFVVGWPTKNFVAEFCSVEERNTWYNLMESQISDEKQRENPKRSTVCVNYKCGKTLLCKHSRYVLSAMTSGIRDSWINAIKQNVAGSAAAASPRSDLSGHNGSIDGVSILQKRKRIAYVAPESHI